VGNVVYVSGSGAQALNAGNGASIWRTTSYDYYGASSPVVDSGAVFFGTDVGYKPLIALYASNGAEFWRYNFVGRTTPAVAHGIVYVSSPVGVASPTSLYLTINESTGAYLGANGLVGAHQPSLETDVVWMGSCAVNAYNATIINDLIPNSNCGGSATVPANGGVVIGPGPGVNYISAWH
jgi:hypothetical protein